MNWVLFLAALILAESDGDPNAVGDTHLRNRAYGLCQIRQPYLDDVNRIAGTSHSMADVRASATLSRWCVVTYVRHYGARYERETGNALGMEVAYRIHNGGPDGWRRRSTVPALMRFLRRRDLLVENSASLAIWGWRRNRTGGSR